MINTKEFYELIVARCTAATLQSSEYKKIEEECYRMLKKGETDVAIECFQKLLEITEILCYKRGMSDGIDLSNM